jgi:hypothetical protein
LVVNPKPKLSAILKTFVVGFLLALALITVLVFIFPPSNPPKEERVIQNFNAHRTSFERLRDMLLEDAQLNRVADWGVETSESIVPKRPPAGNFPLNRYNEYLALLKETGGVAAFRVRDQPLNDVGILVYVSGFAADTRHVAVCWRTRAPANQTTSLDTFYKTPKPRTPVYRQIEGNWYVWADW